MPGFHIHISASTVLGIGYGAAAATLFDVPLPTAALATTLCSVSGMLPDLDSGPGRPLHESITFAAAALPMMMVDRFRHWGWTHESMILAGAAMYLFIRFGMGHMLKHWTVHRGIFHSFPVALIFTELGFLVCTTGDLKMRYFKAGAIAIGFLSHLILDEIWSIDFKHAKLKSSFGTACKFWAPCWWADAIAYTIMAGTTVLALNDPVWTQVGGEGEQLHEMATSILKDFSAVEKSAPIEAVEGDAVALAREAGAVPADASPQVADQQPASQPQPSGYAPSPRLVERPAPYRSPSQPAYQAGANSNDGWSQPVDVSRQSQPYGQR